MEYSKTSNKSHLRDEILAPSESLYIEVHYTECRDTMIQVTLFGVNQLTRHNLRSDLKYLHWLLRYLSSGKCRRKKACEVHKFQPPVFVQRA